MIFELLWYIARYTKATMGITWYQNLCCQSSLESGHSQQCDSCLSGNVGLENWFGNRFWETLHVQDLSRIFPPELLEVPAKFNRHKKEQRQTFSWYRMHLNGLSKQQRSRCNGVRSASKTLSIDAFPLLPFKSFYMRHYTVHQNSTKVLWRFCMKLALLGEFFCIFFRVVNSSIRS